MDPLKDFSIPPNCSVSKEDWAATPASVLRWVIELRAENQELKKRLAAIEERLNTNSTNSSKPPSSDPPGTLRNRHKPSGKPKGGQPGHPGQNRQLVPPEEVKAFVEHRPNECSCCGCSLDGQPILDDEPVRHQVLDLPPIVQAEVTEHHRNRVQCPNCRAVTLAQLPPDVPQGMFGPGLCAMVAWLLGGYRLSRRQCQSLLKTGFGVDISLGGLKKTEELVSASIEQAAEGVLSSIQQAEMVNGDDTTWHEDNSSAVLWNFNTPNLAYYKITPFKDQETAKEILGNFDGFLGSDRAKTYGFIPMEKSQTCLGHVDRHFQCMEDRGGDSGIVGAWGKAELDSFFHSWHEFKRGEITRAQLRVNTEPIRGQMEWLLQCGIECQSSKTANTCANLFKALPSFWNCVEHEGIEPTNNSSERGLRHGVQLRRTSFGTKSDGGSRFVERMLTAVETCRLQGRNLYDFLKESVKAFIKGTPAPLLAGPSP
jgi:transposase